MNTATECLGARLSPVGGTVYRMTERRGPIEGFTSRSGTIGRIGRPIDGRCRDVQRRPAVGTTSLRRVLL